MDLLDLLTGGAHDAEVRYFFWQATLIPTTVLAPFIVSRPADYFVVKLCLEVVDFRLLHLKCGTVYHKNFETVKL